jgi:hypothetical protein
MPKIKDLTGKRFGRLIVLKMTLNRNKRGILWECQCDCGNIKEICRADLLTKTKSCGCLGKETRSKNGKKLSKLQHKFHYRGTKDISQSYIARVKQNSNRNSRHIEYNLTIEYLQDLLEKQNYKCALSGIPITGSQSTYRKSPYYAEQTASLDRIDSLKGYIVGNVQWVHKDINEMKWSKSQDRFIELCKLVAKNYE